MTSMPALDPERLSYLLKAAHQDPYIPQDAVHPVILEHCEGIKLAAMLARTQDLLAVPAGELSAEETERFVTMLMMAALMHGLQAGVAYTASGDEDSPAT